MPPESEGGVFVTTKDIYEQLVKLNDQFSKLSETVATLTTLLLDTREEQSDMEDRLRSLESWKYGLPVAYLGVLISLITSLLKLPGKN